MGCQPGRQPCGTLFPSSPPKRPADIFIGHSCGDQAADWAGEPVGPLQKLKS